MSTVYRVIFTAELADNPGRIADRVGMDIDKTLWSATVAIIPGYTTLESVPNILSMAYSGLTNIDPVYAEDSDGRIILL